MRARKILALLALALAASIPQAMARKEAPAGVTTIVVVRHAEKAAEGDDPGLTAAGRARAAALAGMLEHAGVTAIYSSQFRRTRETVDPLSERVGVPVTVEPITADNASTYARDLARHVLERHEGETVVVVNHSNTVPAIVEALGGGPVPAMSEAEYDHVYIVLRGASGARTISAGYPAATR